MKPPRKSNCTTILSSSLNQPVLIHGMFCARKGVGLDSLDNIHHGVSYSIWPKPQIQDCFTRPGTFVNVP